MSQENNDADVAFVRALAEVLRTNDLTELEVERGSKTEGRLSVRVSRGAPVAAPVQAAVAAAPALAATAPVADKGGPEDPAALPGVVTSPMVGTVFMAPEPGAAAFVKIGDAVTEGQTLLIVEAMKTMNHIHAPKSGTVSRIFVDDGAAVEYGAPLMIVG